MKSLDIDDLALAEADDAIRYYWRIRATLGEEFEIALRAAFAAIAQSPQRYPLYDGGPNRKFIMFKRWPYTIYYRDLDDRVWIAAVAHNKRRPGYWAHRTPETP